MNYQFQKHYTREQARELLPRIREWLEKLNLLRSQISQSEQQLSAMMEPGCDIGGKAVNSWIRAMAEMRLLLVEFHDRQILIKDIERGLIDFPAIIGGREVFLCWEMDEEDIEFWHDIDSGYAGREKL
jgi:hypothetical protein